LIELKALVVSRLHPVLLGPALQRLRDELPVRWFDLASWAKVDERLTVRRLVAKHELRDRGGQLLGLVGGNRPAPLQGAVAVVADLAPPDAKEGSRPRPCIIGRWCLCLRRIETNSLPNAPCSVRSFDAASEGARGARSSMGGGRGTAAAWMTI
jgi:hypothetical protein